MIDFLNVAVELASKIQVQGKNCDIKRIWSSGRDLESVIPQLLSIDICACRMHDVIIFTMTSMSDRQTNNRLLQGCSSDNIARVSHQYYLYSDGLFRLRSVMCFLQDCPWTMACWMRLID